MNKAKIRAMVIDDDHVMRDLICDILENRGYEAHASSDPLSSPVYLDSECPCPIEHICTTIIITDINMPYMTGFEFLEHQNSMGCKVQNVAVMSGRWTNEDIEHIERLGGQMFKKPFKIDELEKWLDECEKKLDHNSKLSDMPGRAN